MAAQTLSTNANFDSTTTAGWASGDTLSLNATLTFDADTRYGQRAAVLNSITASSNLGGDLLVDGRNVWWLPFSAATGNVPSLGTFGVKNCTGATSGAQGEFLGVWTALGVAPSAAGGAMPSTGFLKFRSITGTFAAETVNLPGGATATSTGAGTRGWIHWVTQPVLHIFSRINSLRIKGDFFYLANTTGVNGQVVQGPVADYIPMIEVETAAGSNTYEKWAGAFEGLAMSLRAAVLISGVANNGSGLIRITSAAHSLSTGDQVFVAGVGGVTAANGTWTVTVISTTTFDLVGSTFSGTYTASTGMVRFTGSATTPGAVAVSGTSNVSGSLIRITTARPHGLVTGQPAKLSNVGGTTEANGSFIVTVITTTTFDLQNSIYTNAWTSGGQVQLSAWNERVVNTNHFNITGVADNGSGYMRVTVAAPIATRIINQQIAITGAVTSNGMIGVSNSGVGFVYQPGIRTYVAGITGTGNIAALNGTEQTFGYAGAQGTVPLTGTTFGGTYTSGGTLNALSTPVPIGAQFSILSITSGTGAVMRLTLSLPHAISDGATVTLSAIQGTGNIAALAGKPFTAVYVSDTVIELSGTTFGGTYVSGSSMLIDVASLQNVTIASITGTGNIAALNGATFRAVPVSSTQFDLLTASGGTYTSGGVVTLTGDRRGRSYLMGADGKITFGGPTTGWGLLPPSGCKIRVPNVFVSASTLGAFDVNELPQTFGSTTARMRFNINGAVVDLSYLSSSTMNASFAGAYSFTAQYVYVTDQLATSLGLTPYSIDNCGAVTTYDVSGPLSISNSPSGGTASNSSFVRNLGIIFPVNNSTIQSVSGGTFTNNEFPCSMNGAVLGVAISYCQNTTISGFTANGMVLTSCDTTKVSNLQLYERQAGIPATSTTSATITVTASTNTVIDGISFAYGVQNPGAGAFIIFTNASANLRVRNVGSVSAPYDFKNVMSQQYAIGSVFCTRSRWNNFYVKNPRNPLSGLWNLTATSDLVMSDLGTPPGKSQNVWAFIGWTEARRRLWYGSAQTFGAAIGQLAYQPFYPGNHFYDYIVDTASTQNLLTIVFSEKSTTYPSTLAYTIDAGTPKFDGNGRLLMETLNDQITYTWTHKVKGVLSFANIAPIFAGGNTGNHTFTYDLDKGSGFSGTFKALTAANLSAETGISASGVTPRVRIVCNTSSTTNVLTGVGFYATTSAAASTANQYEYNLLNETFTGLQTGTTINIFKVGDVEQVGDFQSTGSSLVVPTPWSADYSAIARLRLCGYLPIDLPTTIIESDQSIPINQTRASAIPLTNPGALSITVTNHGASPVTWNSKQFSITIQDTSGTLTASQIVNYIHWNIAQTGYWNGFRALAWPTMALPNSTSFETVYGTLYGSAGATLKGVRVVGADGTSPVIGFTQMQADDGTYYTPPASATLTIANLVSGTRLLIRRTDTLAVLVNTLVTSGSYAYSYTASGSIPVQIVARNATNSPAYQEWSTTSSLAGVNATLTANQVLDE